LKEADSTVRPVVQRAPEARALVFDEVSTADSQGQDLNFDDLTLGERIGIGAFAEVFKARWHSEEVAVKRLLANNQTQESIDEFWSEVAVMRRLSHPNIVAFKGACQNPSCVVTELLQGNLWDLLHNSRVELPFRERLHMLQDAASGMAHLHSFNPPIVHRDLKSANLLYDKQHRVKVGDFGLSRAKEVQYTMTGYIDFSFAPPNVSDSCTDFVHCFDAVNAARSSGCRPR
jgi:serine/threonine protein kinase